MREGETVTEFTVRRIRAEILEDAAKIVLAETVTPDADAPDPTDISYNIALDHAADALRRAALA